MSTTKRKVIKLAEKTLVVSLPASWVRSNKINKGDELSLDYKDSKIVISKASSNAKSSVTLDGDSLGPLVKRTLWQVYHSGVDRVNVIAKKPETIKSVNDALNQVLGYHVIEQQGSTMVIEDLAKPEQDVEVLFRRFLLLVKTMIDDGTTAIEKNDLTQLEAISKRDTDVNKFAHLCMRAIAKNPQHSADWTNRMHTLIYQVEQLGDEIKELFKETQGTDILPAMKKASNLYSASYKFLFNKTSENAKAVAKANDETRKILKSLKSTAAVARLDSIRKKAVSIQELFLHEVQGVHHDNS